MHQFFTPNGRFLARVEGPVSGNVLLRRQQYRVSDDPERCAAIVRNLLLGKLHNQRVVLGRALRDHGDKLQDDQSPLWRMPTSAWNESLTSCKRKMPTWICCGV